MPCQPISSYSITSPFPPFSMYYGVLSLWYCIPVRNAHHNSSNDKKPVKYVLLYIMRDMISIVFRADDKIDTESCISELDTMWFLRK